MNTQLMPVTVITTKTPELLNRELQQTLRDFIKANGRSEPANTIQTLLNGYQQTSNDATEQAETINKAMAIMEFFDKISETWVQVEALEKQAKRVHFKLSPDVVSLGHD